MVPNFRNVLLEEVLEHLDSQLNFSFFPPVEDEEVMHVDQVDQAIDRVEVFSLGNRLGEHLAHHDQIPYGWKVTPELKHDLSHFYDLLRRSMEIP